jgi:putative tryptophan/tyrosine transport system substrate-binding protein
MRRRDLIAGIAGSAVVSPLAARAQLANRKRRIGVLVISDAEAESLPTEIREGLRKDGYVEWRNIEFEVRSANGKLDLLPSLARELVAIKVDVIVAIFTPCALAAKRAAADIPIVFQAGDAVGSGIVPGLARPGGNLTGLSTISAELLGKCVELLHDMLPSLRRVAGLGYASDPFSKAFIDQLQLAGRATGIAIDPIMLLSGQNEIDGVFEAIERARAEAVVAQGTFSTKQLADLALKHRLGLATIFRSFTEAGALISYGYQRTALDRHLALFVQKVLQGTKPADLPVEQPTEFELVINLKTAKALGLEIPAAFINRANDVIE